MADILIVDDEPGVVQQLTTLLTELDHNAHSTIYPQHLLEVLAHQTPDLILMDIFMPDVDGLQLLAQLRQHPRFGEIPIIMLTSERDDQLLADCLQQGAVDFINKPVRRVVLKARLDAALTARQRLNQLQDFNRSLENIFHAMPGGVVALDKDYRIRFVSNRAAEMLDQSEIIGKPAAAVLGPAIAGPSGQLMRFAATGACEPRSQLLTPGGQETVDLTITHLDESVSHIVWLLFLKTHDPQIADNDRALPRFGRLIGDDPAMTDVYRMIEKVAGGHAGVLILGESGSGKELVAREIHDRGPRSKKPFRAVNCGAIPADLLESEFFGHERGAFTGAVTSKPGLFELAHEGTLFLDEAGDIPLPLQVKLLRVIQEKTVTRIGSVRERAIDVRIIAATHQDLPRMVEEGRFREDLYYRLDVLSIQLPPLRERAGDIPLLVRAFMDQLNQTRAQPIHHIQPQALQALLAHSWPGNVRELYNAMEHAFALSDGGTITALHLPARMRAEAPVETRQPRNEKEVIMHALEQAGFNKGKAASLLGVSPATLYRKRRKYGLLKDDE